MSFYVERYHDICAGHRVVGHEGKCQHLHGHNYRIHFLCTSDSAILGGLEGLDQVGRVVDFSVIKSTLCQWLETNWDHRMLLWEQDPLFEKIWSVDASVVAVPFNPTAENMAQYLVEVVGTQFADLGDKGIVVEQVRVEETAKCSATYVRQ